jgi:tetratricopeptide (TPR) repeat protein
MDKQEIIDKKGKTVTFYSYKGGVGRSMVLVNTACLLAKEGKKVLLIDWDLEAPGLHYFFTENKDALGFVDLIDDSYKFIQTEENNDEEDYCRFFQENMHKYISKNLNPIVNNSNSSVNINPSDFNIDLITAGKFDANYSEKLGDIKWMDFYKKAPAYFRTLAYFLERDYDYIFVDSRTGLADTSGISSMLMPSKLVLVFVLNNQNINGVLEVASKAIDYRLNSNDYRKLDIYPLPSRLENTVITDFENWKSKYTEPFQELFKRKYMLDVCNLSDYFERCSITYYPKHAYGESIPVLNESITDSKNITYDYNSFLTVLKSDKQSWEIISKEKEQENIAKSNEHYNNAFKLFYEKKYDESLDEATKAIELNDKNKDAYNIIGNVKCETGKYVEALENYNKTLDFDVNYVYAYHNIGFVKNKLFQYTDAIGFFNKAIELDPNFAIAYNERAFSKIALLQNEEAMIDLNKSIDLNPKNSVAYSDRSLLEFRLENYENSKKDVLIALELNPNNANAYYVQACLMKLEKDYENAIINIDTAIRFSPTEPVYYLRKAEIFADTKNITGFFENLEIGLNLGLTKQQLKEEFNTYKPFIKDQQFIALLKKYNIDITDLQNTTEEPLKANA